MLKQKTKNILYCASRFIKKYGIMAPFAYRDYRFLEREQSCSLSFYLGIDLYHMSDKERADIYFHGDYFNLVARINPMDNRKYIADRSNYIERIPEFLGRRCLNLKEASIEQFTEFITECPTFFAKRNFQSAGKGLHYYENINPSLAAEIYEECDKNRSYMIEEFIIQHPEIDKIYPRTVSTIRLCTLRTDEGIQLIFNPEIAIASGKIGNSIHSGSYLYKIWIDKKTGRLYDKAFLINIKTRAITYGDTFHRDTKVVFGDFTIPFWQECLDMVTEAAKRFPELSYIGWDVAITKDGPVIIEGNEVSGHIHTYQYMLYLYNGGKNAGIKNETVPLLEKGVYTDNERNNP